VENELEFTGTALATTFILRELITLLVDKGVLSRYEQFELLDRAKLAMEYQQNIDVVENAEVWQIGRGFLDLLSVRSVLFEKIKVDIE
jgi:hypothetical protein